MTCEQMVGVGGILSGRADGLVSGDERRDEAHRECGLSAASTHSGKHAAVLQELSELFQGAVTLGKVRDYGTQAALPLISCCGN